MRANRRLLPTPKLLLDPVADFAQHFNLFLFALRFGYRLTPVDLVVEFDVLAVRERNLQKPDGDMAGPGEWKRRVPEGQSLPGPLGGIGDAQIDGEGGRGRERSHKVADLKTAITASIG